MKQERKDYRNKTVRIKEGATHFQVPDFAGSEFHVEEYWDKLTGKSWMVSDGNIACMIYAVRSVQNELPTDDEVLYGKIGGLGHLVHVSEIEEIEEPKQD